MISFGDDGIVVGEVEKGDGAMEPTGVPAALRERLGQEATAGLLEFSRTTGRAWREDVLSFVAERFLLHMRSFQLEFDPTRAEEAKRIAAILANSKKRAPASQP